MHYHIILTKECNLKCNYCGGGSDTHPREIQYSLDDLKKFISQDKDPILEFYGGEPLLRIDAMKNIMDSITDVKFVIQTNGMNLHKLESKYLEKFSSILVSIDGTKDVTDKARGDGVYERTLQNIKIIRQKGFRGDIVARMTVAQGTDIRENVMHLINLEDCFDHVHWQLDFEMFWEAWEHTVAGLPEWIDSYNSGISSLVDWWISEMKRTGQVKGIVPFIGIMNSLLRGSPARLRCGSGIDFFTIMPDGRISACPVSIDFDFSVIGSIYEDAPSKLVERTNVGEPCTSCDVFSICGGRCLFVNRSRYLLREDGYTMICKTVKHLILEMQKAMPQVWELIDIGGLYLVGLDYPGFNNGCEIIP
ncbi:MAG: TIGR04084 family radical SAM/SPASM domain-containing protein [Candidatus Methanoperedens sp.]|nr:TIGR04084 family radical SAM/SPASM domain-containing protein [Candidatus Methanoperedens sp.]